MEMAAVNDMKDIGYGRRSGTSSSLLTPLRLIE